MDVLIYCRWRRPSTVFMFCSVSVLFVLFLLRGVLVTAKKCSEEGDCLLTDEVRKTVSHAPLLILDVNCTVMRVSSVRTGVYSLLR